MPSIAVLLPRPDFRGCSKTQNTPLAFTLNKQCTMYHPNQGRNYGVFWVFEHARNFRQKYLLRCGDSRLSHFVTLTLFSWQKLLPGDVFCTLGNAPKSFSAAALPRTHWGSLQSPPDTLVGGEGAGCLPQEPQPGCLVRQTPPENES